MGWQNSRTLAPKALNHTAEMKREYAEEIKECINSSVIYDNHSDLKKDINLKSPKFIVDSFDSVTSIFNQSQHSDKIAVLNFASFNNPGGGFIRGAMAQEEALCHASYLYNILSSMPEYYEKNTTMKNRGMYRNRAIYTPNVRFFKGNNTVRVDVLTCAAPNKSLVYKYNNFTEEENTKALLSRIDFISEITDKHAPEIIILGAFGCGVFRNDPNEVANMFVRAFDKSAVKTVVFSIPDIKNRSPFIKALA